MGLPRQQKRLTLTHFHLVARRSGSLCCLGSTEPKQFLTVYSQFQDHFVNRLDRWSFVVWTFVECTLSWLIAGHLKKVH